MLNLDKIIGFVISLGFGIAFLINRHQIKNKLIESTKQTFGSCSQNKVLITEIFIWIFGILLVLASLIFLCQLIKIV